MIKACEECLRRTWLVAALAGAIELAADTRRQDLRQLLALSDEPLLASLGGARRAELRRRYEAFDAEAARAACRRAKVSAVCQHDALYPSRVRAAADAPAVLHAGGDLERFETLTSRAAVAVVGARRASAYGLEVSRSLGRGLAVAGVTVVSGMALGADSAAHEGALEIDGPTLAVLAGGADHCYPSSKRRLFRELVSRRCTVSELPPGFRPFRWCFPARNRIIAGLAELTIVVEAATRSGSLITAEMAQDLGRQVGAVPGRVSSPLAAGTNQLIVDGAHVIRGPRDALDLVCGVGADTGHVDARSSGRAPRDDLAALEPRLRAVLDAVASGRDTLELLAVTSAETDGALVALAELELLGLVKRGPAGRYMAALPREITAPRPPEAIPAPILGGDDP